MSLKRLVLLCLLLLGPSPLATAQPQPPDPFKALELIRPSRVQAAKEFTVPTPERKSLRLSDFKGKVVLLNFWATWCPPCREEMPAMEQLYQRYREKGLAVVALSIDAEGAPVVTPFVREHKLTFPVGLDAKMTVAERYGVRALPSTFLVDRKGNLAALALGARQWDGTSAHALIELLLK